MENRYLTKEDVESISFWKSKTTPETIRKSFNVDLYLKIKRLRNERKNIKKFSASESNK